MQGSWQELSPVVSELLQGPFIFTSLGQGSLQGIWYWEGPDTSDTASGPVSNLLPLKHDDIGPNAFEQVIMRINSGL